MFYPLIVVSFLLTLQNLQSFHHFMDLGIIGLTLKILLYDKRCIDFHCLYSILTCIQLKMGKHRKDNPLY